MNIIFLANVIVFTSVLFYLCDAAYFSDVHWSTAIKLQEYESYRSVSILSYNIPHQTAEVVFSFQAKTSGKSCAFREVHVFLQHGSYPLITPYNETFPPKFYTNRTDAFHVVIQKDADAVSYILPAPRPGLWYFAAFLPKPSSDKIEQKGFDDSCMYGMFVVVESRGVDNIEEISMEKIHEVRLQQLVGNSQALYRYIVPQDTVEYSVIIDSCTVIPLPSEHVDVGNTSSITDPEHNNLNNTTNTTTPTTTTSSPPTTSSSPPTTSSSPPTTSSSPQKSVTCPVMMRLEAEMMPTPGSRSQIACGNFTQCQLNTLAPTLHKWTYIFVEIDNRYSVSEIQFKLRFEKKDCESLKLMLPRTLYKAMTGTLQSHNPLLQLPQDSCIKMAALGRFIWDQQTYNITYLLSEPGVIPFPVPVYGLHVPDYQVIVTDILVQEPTDIGGTLALHTTLNKTSFDSLSHSVVVYVCLMKNVIPGGETIQSCENGVNLLLNSTSADFQDTVYIPYPEPGTWYLALNSRCFHKDTLMPVMCLGVPQVNIDLSISGCLDGQCGQYGICEDYLSGVHVFSSCKCFAGWRGYGCTDGKYGRSRLEELTAVLLLTLSNVFFVPAIVLAVYRRYFVEAAVYTYTMFFSAIYHACDGSNLIYYCLLNYDILSFADFLGSITAFWVTMLAMSEIPPKVRSFAQTLGSLGVAVGVEYDRHGILVFAVPAAIASIVMFGSWVLQCKRRRNIYPEKKYFLFHLLPGVALAVTGMVLFAFLETEENYRFTHSAWHVAMALSIVFLLPLRRQKEAKTDEVDIVSTDIEPTCIVPTEIDVRTDAESNSLIERVQCVNSDVHTELCPRIETVSNDLDEAFQSLDSDIQTEICPVAEIESNGLIETVQSVNSI